MHEAYRALSAAFEMYGGRPEDRPMLNSAMQRLLCKTSVARLASEPGAANAQPELSECLSKARCWGSFSFGKNGEGISRKSAD